MTPTASELDRWERIVRSNEIENDDALAEVDVLALIAGCREAIEMRAKLATAEVDVRSGAELLDEAREANDGHRSVIRSLIEERDSAQSGVRRLTEALAEVGNALAKCQAERDASAARVDNLNRELREAREVAVRNATDCGHLRQSAIALATQLATLTRLAREVVAYGHPATCAAGHSTDETRCTCGKYALAAALREQEGK